MHSRDKEGLYMDSVVRITLLKSINEWGKLGFSLVFDVIIELFNCTIFYNESAHLFNSLLVFSLIMFIYVKKKGC